MDSAHQAMIAALQSIRDTAANALKQIEQPLEQRSMRWTCKECRYIKHFTRSVSLEGAGRCPRCKCTEFRPVL
jgi:predicted Zn-ribbon and HTH transcriptional regulator